LLSIFTVKDIQITLPFNSMIWSVLDVSPEEFEAAAGRFIGDRPGGDNGKYRAAARELVISNAIDSQQVGAFFMSLKMSSLNGVQYVVE
jgi:hypothetical protein